MMVSFLFSSKWFCPTLVLILAVVLIRNSLAIKCHKCDSNGCSLDECGYAGGGLTFNMCRADYDGLKVKTKECTTAKSAMDDLGKTDGCKDGVNSFAELKKDYELSYEHIKQINPTSPDIQGKTVDEYAKEKWEEVKALKGYKDEGHRACVCGTDGCNDDAFDKKNMPKNAAPTVLVADSGNLGAVMFLALAVLAALVPGSGFRRSQ